MKTILIFAVLGIVALAVLKIFLASKHRANESAKEESTDGALPSFYKKPPMTAIEQAMYYRLISALPDYIVLAQVQISQIVGIRKGPAWQTWFNKISRKSVDFLICHKDFSIMAAMELDDSTHDTEERQAKDADKDIALTNAGIKIIRFRAGQLPTSDVIQSWLHA